MLFGLHGAAAMFQRLIDWVRARILSQLHGVCSHTGMPDSAACTRLCMPFSLEGMLVVAPHQQYTVAYIDDIIIYSNDWGQYIKALQAVLQELRLAGLTANQGKCALGKTKNKYLGFLVGQGCIRLLTDKVEAIRDYSPPWTRKQMRAFLRLASYYLCFRPRFVEVMATLTDLLKGRDNGPIWWDELCLEVFQKTQKALCQDVVLETPDFMHFFILQTDASNRAMRAVLS